MQRGVFLFLFLINILNVGAQTVSVLNLKSGLSNNYVQSILQDKQGYIWIGTRDGLNRYNGHQMDVFKNPLPSTFIYSLMQDSGGRIWIGTSHGGVSIYDPSTETFNPLLIRNKTYPPLQDKDVYTIFEDLQHNIWLGTLQGLVFIPKNRDSVSLLRDFSGGVELSFTAIHQDKNNLLWLGTNKGLFHVKKNYNQLTLDVLAPISGFENTYIRDIIEDKRGNIWIATDGNGIYKVGSNSKIIKNYTSSSNQGLNSNNVWKLYLDHNDLIWAALINGGLQRYEASTDSFINKQSIISPVLNSESITGVLEDFNGNIWVASHGDGVCYFNPKRYVFEKHLSGERNQSSGKANIVSSFFEESNGAVLIGTDGNGLKKLTSDRSISKAFTTKEGLSSNVILDIIEDQEKGKWLATWQGGVNYIDKSGQAIRIFNDKNSGPLGLKSSNVKALMKDTSSNIWMVTHGKGISVYSTRKKTFIDPLSITSGFSPEMAQWGSDIIQSKSGDVWIASHAGLSRISGNDVRQYHKTGKKGSLSSSLIYCLFEDSGGGIWVGTNSSLEKYLPEKDEFENYTAEYGILGDIKCILEDAKKHLWLSAGNEIIEFAPETQNIRHFDKSYNIQEGQFHECACFKSKNGKLYFGGTEGFNAFYPDSLKEEKSSSKVLITNLYLFNKKQRPGEKGSVIHHSMPYTQNLSLTYEQNVVSFEFLALNYSSNHKDLYSYKMDGFDKDWSPISEARMATYTNLDPGNYTFKVRALSINKAVLNETGVNIEIVPPFWKTLWFRYLIISLTLLGIVVFFQLRLNIARKQSKVLQQLVEQRTEQLQKSNVALKDLNSTKDRLFSIIAHDLRNPFTSLLGFSRLLTSDFDRFSEEEKRKLIGSVHHSSSSLYSLLENLLVWSKSQQSILVFSPEKLYLKSLVHEHFDLIKDEAEKKNIRLVFAGVHEVAFLADRNMVSIIFRNLLSNALKYSPPGGSIEVDYAVRDGLEVFVKDEGVGIESGVKLFKVTSNDNRQRDHNHGLGLILCREFVEKHGGQINARNNEEKGALFSFTLPSSNPEIIEKGSDIPSAVEVDQFISANLPFSPSMSGAPLILVAEDDNEIRWYIKSVLFPDFEVIEAANGVEAEALTLQKNPDIILSDIAMPRMNGLDLCQKIKSHPQTSHIPFILLTAERDSEKKITGYQYGADDYITKPIQTSVLRARLLNLLESRKRLKSIYQKDITSDPEEFTSNTIDQEFLEKLNNIIHSQFTNPDLNPDTLAREVNMSRTGLYMKVKGLTGESVGIYIRNIRLKEAKKILKEQKMNVSEVAYTVGFNQLPYFTTCFKEAFGITPSEFVKRKE